MIWSESPFLEERKLKPIDMACPRPRSKVVVALELGSRGHDVHCSHFCSFKKTFFKVYK